MRRQLYIIGSEEPMILWSSSEALAASFSWYWAIPNIWSPFFSFYSTISSSSLWHGVTALLPRWFPTSLAVLAKSLYWLILSIRNYAFSFLVSSSQNFFLPPSFLSTIPKKHIVFMRDTGIVFGSESHWGPIPKTVYVLKSLQYLVPCSLLNFLMLNIQPAYYTLTLCLQYRYGGLLTSPILGK